MVLIEGLALGSAFLAGVSSVVITPVAKQGMAIRLLVVRSGFAALFISVGLFLLPPEIGFGTVTSFGVGVTVFISGPVFALGTLIYYRGIRSLGLARAYSMVNTFPLFSTLLAVLLSEKDLTGWWWLGLPLLWPESGLSRSAQGRPEGGSPSQRITRPTGGWR